MRLYAIRIVNGEKDETVVVTADNPEEALEQVGLPAALLLAPNESAEEPSSSLAKRYQMTELTHLQLHFRWTDGDNLSLHDVDQSTYECLFKLHPAARLPAMVE